MAACNLSISLAAGTVARHSVAAAGYGDVVSVRQGGEGRLESVECIEERLLRMSQGSKLHTPFPLAFLLLSAVSGVACGLRAWLTCSLVKAALDETCFLTASHTPSAIPSRQKSALRETSWTILPSHTRLHLTRHPHSPPLLPASCFCPMARPLPLALSPRLSVVPPLVVALYCVTFSFTACGRPASSVS